MRIGGRDFDLENKSYLMGILNITPDSFSDGGSYHSIDEALLRVEEMISEGASIIDVGGESTRPGADEVGAAEEMERVLPVIEAINKNFDIPLSLDTYKYQVARAGIAAGADMINDIRGLRLDEGQMGRVIAEAGVPCVLMHYGPLEGFFSVIDNILQIAADSGIKRDKIILDPGIGFGKRLEENLMVMKRLPSLARYKLPVLLGTSRKSMIGHVLDLPGSERLEGTIATTVMGRMAGISIFRVHDIKSNYRALKMTDAILEASLL